MSILESRKKIVERVTGWQRLAPSELEEPVRLRKANTFWFKDDGVIPNHPHWPLIVYRGAVKFTEVFDPAAVFEELFERNGWGKSWRNGIYDYVHYHSSIHEVLGVNDRGIGTLYFRAKGTPCLGVVKGTPVSARSGEAGRGCAA